MVRSSMIAAGAALLCGTGFAQQMDQAIAITSPIKRGPMINMSTGQRMSKAAEAQVRAAQQTIYNNTCTWIAGYYTGTGDCETYVDEGIIPGGIGRPNSPAGATLDNNVNFFEVGYCSNVATGTVDIKVAFYDSLGGACGGVQPVTPQAAIPVAPNAYFQLPIATMPGDATPGGTGVNCWIIGFNLGNGSFCMQSDGDGVWDNVLDSDRFNWAWQFDNPSVVGQAANGIIIAGDANQPASACTYNIPCGVNAVGGAPCGHGLGQDDGFWVNVDGDLIADGVNTGVACASAPTGGSTCYWFNGFPTNIYGGFHLILGADGSCGGCNGSPVNYCTSGTTSAAVGSCVATIGLASGIPSASNAGPAIIQAANVPNLKTGLIFMGLAQAAGAWGPNGHFLCIAAPTQRTPAQSTGGSAAPAIDCTGTMSIDLNAEIAANSILGQTPVSGLTIFSQGWFRDPGSSKTTAMTNGLSVTLCP